VLVQVALFIFAMSAMLSLIIDIGYAHLTQGQMQSAADSAAIEGIRQRDAVADPARREAARREAVNTVVGWTFDDNFDPTDGDADFQFGAGPVLDLTEGATSLHGLQTSSVPDQHVYKPNLQANPGNAPEGDMVSGRFCYSADPLPSESVAYEMQDTVCGQPQLGAGAYARNDFNPGGANANAFLVRLRRSNEYQDLEGRTDPDVGSSGPSLPLTFGKATTIHGDDPAATYSVRRDGLTVRATAIAETRPVVRFGLQQVGARGMAQFALADTCVQSPTGAAVTIPVSIDPNGVITRTNAPGAPQCGRFIVPSAGAQVPRAVRTIGTLLPAPVARACPSVQNTPMAYSPIYSQMANGQLRVIGYATVTLTRTTLTCPPVFPGRPIPPVMATIARAGSVVAPSNASATFADFPAVPPALITELVAKNQIRNGAANYGPVLAPVLAR